MRERELKLRAAVTVAGLPLSLPLRERYLYEIVQSAKPHMIVVAPHAGA